MNTLNFTQIHSIFIFLLIVCVQQSYGQFELFSPVNDSTIARYRYEVEERSFAEIPMGSKLEDIDLSERDRLKSIHQIFKVTEGVNQSSEAFYQVVALKSEHIEDWLSTPHLRLLSPRGSYGYDNSGNLEYFFPSSELELNTSMTETQNRLNHGYFPVMQFFPNRRSEFVEEMMLEGFLLTVRPKNAFELSRADETLFFDPENRHTTHSYIHENILYEVETQYVLYAPYGYVPLWEREKTTRQDLSHPVSFWTYRSFTNHVIEDLNQVIGKYTDESHIKVFPNPISGQYEVALNGIPDALVGMVQVRDHMGNIITTYNNPVLEGDILSLNADNYPSGVLILIVTTSQGIYTSTIIKS